MISKIKRCHPVDVFEFGGKIITVIKTAGKSDGGNGFVTLPQQNFRFFKPDIGQVCVESHTGFLLEQAGKVFRADGKLPGSLAECDIGGKVFLHIF